MEYCISNSKEKANKSEAENFALTVLQLFLPTLSNFLNMDNENEEGMRTSFCVWSSTD